MTGFDLVLLGFTWFYWVLLGFTELNWVLLGFNGFNWFLMARSRFQWFLVESRLDPRFDRHAGTAKKRNDVLFFFCSLFSFLILFPVTTSTFKSTPIGAPREKSTLSLTRPVIGRPVPPILADVLFFSTLFFLVSLYYFALPSFTLVGPCCLRLLPSFTEFYSFFFRRFFLVLDFHSARWSRNKKK